MKHHPRNAETMLAHVFGLGRYFEIVGRVVELVMVAMVNDLAGT